MFIEALDQQPEPRVDHKKTRFTQTQGQYLVFIHTYVLLNRQAPAEADFQRFFGVTAPSVHQMIIQLERLGFIRRIPRQARSIELLVARAELPELQPITSPVARY